MSAPVVDSVLELIGHTPLVRLARIASAEGAHLWAKCEHLNPGGSVKDRICIRMLDEAAAAGKIERGSTVVEPTSGNTGIGLALVSAVRGYRLVLTMPASMSLERRQLLEAYGAEIVLTEPERAMEGAIDAARRVAAERGGFIPEQFGNSANPRAHAEGTAAEIIEAFEGERVDAFVAAVGTGGTVSGVGRAFKERYPGVRIFAVEPAASPVLSGGPPGPSKIQGLNAGFVPENYDAAVVDEIIHVSDRDAYDTKRRLAREEGLLVGISAGANVWAASRVAASLGKDKNVVTILCDTGERYFSLDTYFKLTKRRPIMPVTVRIPTPLRTLTGGQDEVSVDGATVRDVIESLEKAHPGLKERLLDEKGVRRFVNIYANDEDIRFLDNLNTNVKDGDAVSIVPAIAGGR